MDVVLLTELDAFLDDASRVAFPERIVWVCQDESLDGPRTAFHRAGQCGDQIAGESAVETVHINHHGVDARAHLEQPVEAVPERARDQHSVARLADVVEKRIQ